VTGALARVAVVGHVEWVEFAIVDRLPAAGDIVAARGPTFFEPGGGGAVAAVQLARLAGDALFLTSVGDDAAGERAARELAERHGVDVHATVQDVAQRRAFTHLDAAGERTITQLGERHVPHGGDDLPWDRVAACDAVYFTGGDVAALQKARAARVLVATPRARDALLEGSVQVDVLVASAADEGERVDALDPPPRVVVLTEGAKGGRWEAAPGAASGGGDGGGWAAAPGASGRWDPVAPPGDPVDAYGCGDTFAAALTLALGRDLALDAALAFAAACGAHVLTGRGPYGSDLPPAPQPRETRATT
jgi:ribokinase